MISNTCVNAIIMLQNDKHSYWVKRWLLFWLRSLSIDFVPQLFQCLHANSLKSSRKNISLRCAASCSFMWKHSHFEHLKSLNNGCCWTTSKHCWIGTEERQNWGKPCGSSSPFSEIVVDQHHSCARCLGSISLHYLGLNMPLLVSLLSFQGSALLLRSIKVQPWSTWWSFLSDRQH